MMKLFRAIPDLVGKNRRKLWFSFLLNAVFLFLLLLIVRPYYETNDDVSLQSFFNLSRGVQDPYTRSANYIFGWILSVAYRITRQLPWYSLFFYFVIFVSLTSLSYIILSRFRDGWLAGMLVGMILLVFGYQTYIVINFTRVSAVAAASGTILTVNSMRGRKADKWGILIGALLVFAGYIIRPQGAIAACACASAAGIWLLLGIPSDAGKGRRNRLFARYLICLLPVVILVAGAKAMDVHERETNPARQEFYEYGNERIAVMDHGFPKFKENKEAFKKLGINYTAWQLYKKWNFYDPEKMSKETMTEIAKLQQDDRITANTVISFLKIYPGKAFLNQVCLLYLAVLALCIVYGRKGKRELLAVFWQILVVGILLLYLFSTRRYGMPRVEAGMWMGCIAGILPILEDSRARISRKTAVAALLFVLIFSQKDWNVHYRRQTQAARDRQINYRNYTSMLSNDTEHLYLFPVTRFFPDNAYSPFDRIPENSLYNLSPLGGWTAMSIPFLAVYERYGVTNPYRDMIGNDKIRLVTDDPDIFVKYLRDYYDPDCSAKKVGTIGESNIYTIVG